VLDIVKPRVAGLRERTVLVALVARVRRLAWGLGQQLLELVLCLSRGEVRRVGLGPVGGAPDDRAARCAPTGLPHVGGPKAFLVASVGVAPERVPVTLAAAAPDLQMP
jgi:hypothetical protein